MNVYYSASMRGTAGDAASDEQLDANNERAYLRSAALAAGLGPGTKIFVPHRYEPALRPPWRAGLIAAEELLLLDRGIIALCEVVMIDSDPAESAGVRAELGYAEEFGLPAVHTWRFDKDELERFGAAVRAITGADRVR